MKTIEEIRAYHDSQNCDDCTPETACMAQFTREELEAYAAVYGCICGVRCNRCIEWKYCFSSEESQKEYLESIGE